MYRLMSLPIKNSIDFSFYEKQICGAASPRTRSTPLILTVRGQRAELNAGNDIWIKSNFVALEIDPQRFQKAIRRTKKTW